MLFWISIYFVGVVVFNLWDAFIGFGVEFEKDINIGPTAWLASFIWPIAFPICMICLLSSILESVKDSRLEREAAKKKMLQETKRMRIADEKEQEKLLSQIEEEMYNEAVHVGNTRSNRKKAKSR